ncbi:hypothetical protein STM14_0086 [Salmonella enterica subsp. enterica serovar Typhimurium str. 14028S]|uniref:Uncharacterized protein n=2 Tax=Salmonella enterica I TaxID=59201 RepID=A0A0F6AWK2_SALT1|nr:hypothetical protein SPAB_00089 [Salmonella enterica subsp. enterica serovar Paratyphi B str. SPB7]ACY86623.1 hypothetical protein STM14_0086 [Salmonella enterica subsp. enterica serovar Typhimurium str. 14028S]
MRYLSNTANRSLVGLIRRGASPSGNHAGWRCAYPAYIPQKMPGEK